MARSAIVGVFFAVAPIQADVLRNISFTDPGVASVEVVWSFDKAPASSLLVRESLPPDWAFSFDGGAHPSVRAVRETGGDVSFLVARGAASRAGKIVYTLTSDRSAAIPSISGLCYTSSLSGMSASEVIRGVETAYASAVGEPESTEGAPSEFRIRAFEVTSGEHPRATFAWSGAGGKTVTIQWRPTLGGPAEVPDGRRTVAASSADGWSTFAVAADATPVPEVRARGISARSVESEEAVYEFTPDVDAPAGFYRLVVTGEE